MTGAGQSGAAGEASVGEDAWLSSTSIAIRVTSSPSIPVSSALAMLALSAV